MRTYRYLVVGGGMTGDAAVRGIREHDAEGRIGLVSAEAHPPYARPPLSKGLWQGKEESSIWRGTAELDVDLVLERRIEAIDPDAHTAIDERGEVYAYEKLLLATGGSPRRLRASDDVDVVYFRTLDDYHRLHDAARESTRAFVIGGGFIGSEIAAALAMQGCSVTMAFPEEGIGARIFPLELATYVNEEYGGKGVKVLTGVLVTAIDRDAGVLRVHTDGGAHEADVVVAGLGIAPATGLAEAAGLPVEDGVVVDRWGRVAGRDDVYAAGDVARFPVPALGTSMRVEHEDHANTHGSVVGANLAGAGRAYDHLPFFYSDLFELGYEAVGDVDSRLESLAVWSEPYRSGVVCYVDGERRPRGFLLWDVWGKVDAARDLIRAGEPTDDSTLRELIG